MKKKWEKFEDELAKDFGGIRHKASGSLWYKPADASNGTYLLDGKQTDKKSYAISLKTWDKLYEEALFSQKIPILALQIQETKLVVLTKENFLDILKKITS